MEKARQSREGRGNSRKPTPSRAPDPGPSAELKRRAAAGLVYFVGIATGILARAAMGNEPAFRYHDHRAAFATAAQVLVGLLIAFAVETRFRGGASDRVQGIQGGTLLLMCGGLACSLVGSDLSPVTRGGGGIEGLVSFCFAFTCGALAAGVVGLVTIYFSPSS